MTIVAPSCLLGMTVLWGSLVYLRTGGICLRTPLKGALGAPSTAPKSQLTGIKWRAAHFFRGREAQRIMESFNCLAWLDV